MVKLILTVLMAVALIALSGCGEDAPASEETGGASAEPGALSALFEDYALVRPEICDDLEVKAAILVRGKLEELGVKLTLTTDWVRRGETPPADTAELLVGTTNRAESVAARDGMRRDDWSIGVKGNRVYVTGGSADAVYAAAEYFCENCTADGGAVLTDGYRYDYRPKYKLDSLSFGGKAQSAIKLSADEGAEGYAVKLAELLGDYCGMEAEVLGSDKRGEATLLIKTEGKANEYSSSVVDGRLVIRGGDKTSLKMAYNEFIGKVLSEALDKGGLDAAGTLFSGSYKTKEEQYKMTKLIAYPEYPEQIRRNYDYSVSVTQDKTSEKLTVYSHTQENYLTGRAVGGDIYRRFCEFAFSGAQVRVDIKVNFDFDSYTVMPSALGLKSEYKNGVISVYLDKPEYFTLELDGDLNTLLAVFADYPEADYEIPEKGGENVIYVEGWTEVEGGVLIVPDDNTTLYLAPGSVLFARVSSRGKNVTVCGRGAIVDPFGDIFDYDITVGGNEGKGTKLLTISGEGTEVRDVKLLDARCFNLAISAGGVKVENFKALSTMMTTDGISVYSGKGTKINHCYLHVGDNALVLSSADTEISNIMIGTTCAAIFPQGSPENISLKNLYIFRANEGIINNYYNGNNPGTTERTVHMSIENLDAVDCVHVPWLFQGRNMGKLEKVFTFKNIYLPEPTGTATITDAGNRALIKFANGKSYLETENYTLDFTNLYVGGRAVTSASQFVVEESGTNAIKLASDGGKAVARKDFKAGYVCPDKLYIGDRRVALSVSPAISGEKVSLPASELLAALGYESAKLPDSAEEKNGVAMLDYGKLRDYGVLDSSYDAKKGIIRLNVSEDGRRLLRESGGLNSRWTEYVCYKLDLTVSTDDEDGGRVYNILNATQANVGMTRMVTNELKQYGEGSYTVTFKVRTDAEYAGNAMKVTLSNDKAKVEQSINVTSAWAEQKVTFKVGDKVKLSESEMVGLIFTTTTTKLPKLCIKDIAMVKAD